MLQSLSTITDYAVQAVGSDAGSPVDVYFDDRSGRIRYLVVDTSNWLPGRKVLVPPNSVLGTDDREKLLAVAMTRDQIEHAPPITHDKPVTRQYETALHDHFDWRPYWSMEPVEGPQARRSIRTDAPGQRMLRAEERDAEYRKGTPSTHRDPHLFSVRDIVRYDIEASDGSLGRVTDVVFDDDEWRVEGIIVSTRRLLPGGEVEIPFDQVREIDIDERAMSIGLTCEEVRQQPKPTGVGQGR